MRRLISLLVVIGVVLGLAVGGALIVNPGTPRLTSVSFGPDGDTLALTYKVGACPTSLILYRLSDGSARFLLPPQGEAWSQPVISPNSAQLAMVSQSRVGDKRRNARILVTDMDGEHRRYWTLPDAELGSPTFSADSQKLFVVTHSRSVERAQGAPFLTEREPRSRLSEDSAAPKYGIFALSLGDGTWHAIVPQQFTWLSKALQYGGTNALLFLGSGHTRLLSSGRGELGTNYTINAGIFVHRRTTGSIEVVDEIGAESSIIRHPSLSADGTVLVFSKNLGRYRDAIYRVDAVRFGQETIVLEENNVVDLAVSPDGDTIALVSSPGTTEPWFMPLGGKPELSLLSLRDRSLKRLGVQSQPLSMAMRSCRFK